MREGAWIGVLEGKCCIVWSFLGWEWLKKGMAFDLAGVVSTWLYCLQGYLNPKTVSSTW
jgi:hypothetical protein